MMYDDDVDDDGDDYCCYLFIFWKKWNDTISLKIFSVDPHKIDKKKSRRLKGGENKGGMLTGF